MWSATTQSWISGSRSARTHPSAGRSCLLLLWMCDTASHCLSSNVSCPHLCRLLKWKVCVRIAQHTRSLISMHTACRLPLPSSSYLATLQFLILVSSSRDWYAILLLDHMFCSSAWTFSSHTGSTCVLQLLSIQLWRDLQANGRRHCCACKEAKVHHCGATWSDCCVVHLGRPCVLDVTL